MHKYFKALVLPIAAVAMVAAAPASASVFVTATSSTPTALGSVIAGTSYTVTATGIANIYEAGGLDFDADGVPTHLIAAPYAAFNTPGCCYNDPTNSSSFGPAGLNGLLGALVGTFLAAPSSSADYFQLGKSFHFTATSSATLYGLVNDASTAYSDNKAGTGFTVSLTADRTSGSVPEPGAWTLMILGFGGVGATLRSSRRQAPATA